MSETNMRVKVICGNKIKVFILKNGTSFQKMRKIIIDLFPDISKNDLMKLSLEDESSDWVDIDSDEELLAFLTGYEKPKLNVKLEVKRPKRNDDNTSNSKEVCKNFQKGRCRFGSLCKFRHQENLTNSRNQNTLLSDKDFLRWLKNLECMKASEVIENLTSEFGISNLKNAFLKDPGKLSFADKLIAVISEEGVRSSMLREKTNKIYSSLSDSTFMLGLHSLIQSKEKPSHEVLSRYIAICEEVQSRTANGWKFVPLETIKARVEELEEGPEKVKFLQEIKRLLEHRDDLRRKFAVSEEVKIEDSFREMSIIPTNEEILTMSEDDLPVNKIKTRYNSITEYLRTHFLLLRGDCLLPIKYGIEQFSQNIKNRDVKMYFNVRLVGLECGYGGLSSRVSFKLPGNRPVRWESSKRLMFGSLLCLSSDNFKTMTWGTVSNRNLGLLEKGMVDLRILVEEPHVKELSQDLEYLMAESSSSYFEAYLHVLKSLQRPEMERIPFQENLLHLEPSIGPPEYLLTRLQEDKYNFEPAFPGISQKIPQGKNLRILAEWPQWESQLDSSQMEALKRALTKKLALIQGPPGTGKTFLGLLAVKLLLANLYSEPDLRNLSLEGILPPKRANFSPILVVCYTNHALDQFLSGILSMEPNLIRMGGQCKDETLKKRDLNILMQMQRNRRDEDNIQRIGLRAAREEQREINKKMGEEIKKIRSTEVNSALLEGVATDGQRENLFLGSFGDLEELTVRRWLEGKPQFEVFWGVEREEKSTQGNNFVENRFGQLEGQISDFESESDESDGSSSENEGKSGGNGGKEEEENGEDDPKEIEEITKDREFGEEKKEEKEDSMMMFTRGETGGNEGGNEAGNEGEDDGWQVVQRRNQRNNLNFTEILPNFPFDLEQEEEFEEDVALEDIIDFENVWSLGQKGRELLHRYWLDEIHSTARRQLAALSEEYREASRKVREAENEVKLQLLRSCRVLGMTTTGAARHHDLLLSLKPEIVVVEEAAEVLECHIIACLSPFTRHLILIGDHCQLRPSVGVYRLAVDHHLDVSLFERLSRNGTELSVLSTQHRMRPYISRLISPIYPHLRDHESVMAGVQILGVKQNLFFLSHNAREQGGTNSDSGSKSNIPEADLVVSLCCYLLKQGYSADQVTVLSMYTGQILEIKKRLRAAMAKILPEHLKLGPGNKGEGPRVVPRVTSVDNFQGEESDIVLLSLVRNNEIPSKQGPGTIGFLRTENRICVALSRAKLGMYLFGNADLLARCSPLWAQVISQLSGEGQVGPRLTLCCQNHPDKLTHVAEAGDFADVADGGCSLPCQRQLDCGHACPRMCHPGDHSRVPCHKACLRALSSCSHSCPARCHGLTSRCPPCQVAVRKPMPLCGHLQKMKCSTVPEDHACTARCEKILPCGHLCQKICSQECTSKCRVEVSRKLPCGHTADVPCHLDPSTVKCTVPCTAVLSPCSHPCTGTCSSCQQGTSHKPCQKPCKRTLPCGHSCRYNCGTPCPPCTARCPKRCQHSICRLPCGLPCVPCREKCTLGCPHSTCEALCWEKCTFKSCSVPCPKILPCGHSCLGLCGEKCSKVCGKCRRWGSRRRETFSQMLLEELEPEERLVQLEDCPHFFLASAMDQWMAMDPSLSSGDVALKPKECPNCRAPIFRSKRYINIIKENQEKLEVVKRIKLGYEAVNEGNLLLSSGKNNEAEEKFKEALKLNPTLPEGHLGLATVFFKRESSKKGLRFFVSLDSKAQSLPEAIGHLVAIIRKSNLANCLKKIPLNTIISSDFEFESSTPPADVAEHAAVQLAKILCFQSKFSEALEFSKAVLEILPGNLEIIQVKKNAEAGETKVVIEVMKREVGGVGHWYICPNGHPYTIGNCGRPMEVSRCPECNSTIGGTSHQSVEGNRQWSAMEFNT